MPRNKSRNGSASHLPALVDPRLVRALDHVVRQHILLAMVQEEVSPNDLSKALGEGLSQVSYHVKVLRDECDGMIERTRTEQRRGALQSYYRANIKALLPAKAWRGLKKGMRAVIGAGMASDLFNDLAKAQEAGKLQGQHDHIVRMPLALDQEGQRNVKAIAERASREIEDEQGKSGDRAQKANGGSEIVGYTFGLLAFEAAWKPADLRDLATQAEAGAASGVGRKSGKRKTGGRARGTAAK